MPVVDEFGSNARISAATNRVGQRGRTARDDLAVGTQFEDLFPFGHGGMAFRRG